MFLLILGVLVRLSTSAVFWRREAFVMELLELEGYNLAGCAKVPTYVHTGTRKGPFGQHEVGVFFTDTGYHHPRLIQ